MRNRSTPMYRIKFHFFILSPAHDSLIQLADDIFRSKYDDIILIQLNPP